ncbi:MAG: competence protein ComEC [Cytophagaceae bacterium]|nr:competence protein ComEC [Gemmatimonadaceae bacterium]
MLKVSTASAAALLAGEVEARAEAEMLARHEPLRADVLVVPHHGSRTSSTAAFLDGVAPSEAIFTVGYRNRFGHPHPAVLSRYEGRGIHTWRSDHDGALRVALSADGAHVQRLVTRWRYWSDRRGAP